MLEAVLGRDRAFVLAGLVGVSLLAWAYMILIAGDPSHAPHVGIALPRTELWSPLDFLLVFVMWSVMMVGMMVPTASNMVLTYATISRKYHSDRQPYVPAAAFLTGYVILWTAFSAVATLAEWALHRAALITPLGASTHPIFGGVLLLVAGVFQWTPLKHACLTHCRSPLLFLMTDWREGG